MATRRSPQRGVRRRPAVARRQGPRPRDELQDVCSRALQGFLLLSVLLAPVLPALTRRVARELFGMDRDFVWSDAATLPTHDRRRTSI